MRTICSKIDEIWTNTSKYALFFWQFGNLVKPFWWNEYGFCLGEFFYGGLKNLCFLQKLSWFSKIRVYRVKLAWCQSTFAYKHTLIIKQSLNAFVSKVYSPNFSKASTKWLEIRWIYAAHGMNNHKSTIYKNYDLYIAKTKKNSQNSQHFFQISLKSPIFRIFIKW